MSTAEAHRRTVNENYSKLPLTFVANSGQAPSKIYYLTNQFGYGIGFTPEEAIFVFSGDTRKEREGLALSLHFLAANPAVKLEACSQGREKFNYLLGNDPANWHTGLSVYREVIYRELWQGVDMIFHGEAGKLKYEIVVQPGGARLDIIQLAYRGADRLSLDKDGNLLIHSSIGVLTEQRPVSYQEIAGKKEPVESRFVIKQSEPGACVYGFEIEDYRPDYALIIDPALDYSTYLGGGSTETGFAIAVDSAGNAYVTGQTVSTNFPLTPGAFQTAIGASSDAFVTKLNAEGTSLVYSTLLGGNSLDLGIAIAVDGSGNAYVTGQTLSSDFPVTLGAFQTVLGGNRDAFVTKLSADGSALVYSTYLGGSSVDNGNAIAIDGSGNAYVTGSTASADFPVTPGAFQTTGGDILGDVFVTKLSLDGSSLHYSTFIAGSSIDEGFAIAVDGSSNAYVAGRTFSPDFPTTPGAFQIASAGSAEAFALKLNAAGTALIYSTYLGGSGSDTGKGIAIDGSGNAYIVGLTFSADFPVTPGAFQSSFGGVSDAFVTKVSADGTSLIYSTYLGGSGSEDGTGIKVLAGIAYVTGSTGSSEFPVTSDAIGPTLAGGTDVYFSQFDVTGSSLVFSTYLGGSSNDGAMGIALDSSGSVYLTGQTVSSNYLVTPGAFQQALAGGGDSFVTKIEATAELAVQKFSDRFEVRPGETVTFFIEVVNPSSVTLTNVAINDALLGFSVVIPELFSGDVRIFEVVFTVPDTAAPGLLINTASIQADQLTEPAIAQSEIFVTESPALLAAKSVNPSAAAPGETVVFSITLQNIGNNDLINVRITDPLIGLDETADIIRVGEIITIEWPFLIPSEAQAGTTIANTLDISANNLPQTETVGTIVDVLAVPRLALTKTADRTVVPPGETVTFTVTVSNTGNTTLTNIVVTDDLNGFSAAIPSLAIGQTEELPVPFLVPLEMPPQTYLNRATAVSDQTVPVSANAEITVDARPLLGVSKVPSSTTVMPGQTFNYTVTLSNIGNVPLTNIQVTDLLLGFDQTIENLAVGGSLELEIPFTVPQDSPIGSDIVNRLAVATEESGAQQVESTVTVEGAGLSLLKIADKAFAEPGETINYTITMFNLLAVPQTNIVLSDILLGIIETVDILPANGMITRFTSFTVPVDAANGSVIANTFTASSDQTPLQETTAVVVVRTVAGAETTLTALKLPDRSDAAPGETINYTIQVTNSGSNPATNVEVSDSLTGGLTIIPVIAPGETKTITFSFTIPLTAVQGDVIANRVAVTWPEHPPGSLPIQSEARVTVAMPSKPPEINIEATPETAPPGQTVIKTITVVNAESHPLTNVRVIDSLLGFDTLIPSLATGEKRVFTLPFTIPLETTGGTTFTNTVTVFSDQTPQQQAPIVIEAQSLTDAELSHTVDRSAGRPGETVVFITRVRSRGNVALINAILTITLPESHLRIAHFDVGAVETIRVPFVLPDVEEDTVITSLATFVSDNGPIRQASASVSVLAEEEE